MNIKTCLIMLFALVPAIESYASWTDITISSDYQIGNDAQFIVVNINGDGTDAIKVDINGGSIGTLKSNGVTEITMLAGTISNDFYSFHPGYPYYCPPQYNVYLNDTSKLTIRGGTIEGFINISNDSQMDVYGYNFQYTPIYSKSGCLHGYWQNGQELNLNFVNGSFERVILHEIPEPTTMVLLLSSMSCFLLKKVRRK